MFLRPASCVPPFSSRCAHGGYISTMLSSAEPPSPPQSSPPRLLHACTAVSGSQGCSAQLQGQAGCGELLLPVLSLTPSKLQPLSSDPSTGHFQVSPCHHLLWWPCPPLSLVEHPRSSQHPALLAGAAWKGSASSGCLQPTSPGPLLCLHQLPVKMQPSSQLQDRAAWGHQQVKVFSGSLCLHLTRQRKLHMHPEKFREDRDRWAPLLPHVSAG